MNTKFLSNLHTHSTFSDGASTPEEIVLEAISKEFISLGFSDHSYTDNWASYCMQRDTAKDYVDSILRLKEKYSKSIEIYCGIEWDHFTFAPEYEGINFDYTIGGVHYLKTSNGDLYDVDYSLDLLKDAMSKNRMSTRDIIELYYNLVGEMVASLKPDIVAHIDLITKFNEDMRMFDENQGWYMDIVRDVLNNIKNTKCIIEMNTGAISRGYRSDPYPSKYILDEAYKRNIPITISSDSHHKNTLDFHFDNCIDIAKQVGYNAVKIFDSGKFKDLVI